MTEVEQTETAKREVIVVLGVGRSGTSLAMQALKSLGIRISQNLIPPNVSNPKGFYEDANIVEIHKNLLNTLAPSPAMPLKEGWMNTPEANKALKHLKEIVENQINIGQLPWAFKDPRTATFLPLWIRVFNHLKIVPKFILAVRRPEAVIESFAQQYSGDQATTELIYLQRSLDALYYTGNDCHILAYESWFEAPQETLQKLASFVFERDWDIQGIDTPAHTKLKRNLGGDTLVHNPLVIELYGHIQAYLEEHSQRKPLMECVRRQRKGLASFQPWWNFADTQKKLYIDCRDQLKEANARIMRLEKIEFELSQKYLAVDQFKRAAHSLERLNEVTE